MIACTWQLPIECVNAFRRGLSSTGAEAFNAGILLPRAMVGVTKVVHRREREQPQCLGPSG